MDLLNPAALWGLLALAILLLLPRLRLPRRRLMVAAAFLWRDTALSERPRLAVRIRRNLLVILQAAAIILLVLAIARPLLHLRSRTLTVVFDLSASMAARDGHGTRLDSARRAALQRIAAMPFASRVRIVTAAQGAATAGDFAASNPAARAAIDRMNPVGAATDLHEAIALARSLGADDIAVFTDAAPAADDDIEWHTVGSPIDNAAVTAVALRRLPGSPLDAELLAEVRNHGAARQAVLSIRNGERELHRQALTLPANAVQHVTLRLARPSGSYTASIDAQDGLALDDVRTTTGEPGTTRVVLVTRGSFFLERALAAYPGIELRIVTPDEFAAPRDPNELVICDGCRAMPAAGRTLWIARGEQRSAAPIEPAGGPHPLTTPFAEAPVIARAANAAMPADATIVARAGGSAAIATLERDGRRTILTNIDFTSPGFVNETAFPVFVARAIEWLANGDAAGDAATGLPLEESELRQTRAGIRPAASPTAARSRPAPLMTALVLLALVTMVWEWVVFVRGRAARVPRSAIVLRSAALALLIAAAAGISIRAGRSDATVIFAIDGSASVSPGSQRAALETVAASTGRMRNRDRAGLVLFGADAVVERDPAPRPLSSQPSSRATPGGSDIAAALRVARGLLPANSASRIVLVSDGRETTGNAAVEARRAREAGIIVDAAAVAAGGETRPRVTAVRAPQAVRVEEPFAVRVAIAGSPGRAANVTIARDGQTIATRAVTLDANGGAAIAIDDRRTNPGAVAYTATASGEDARTPQAGAVVVASGAPSLLYVAGEDRALLSSLDPTAYRIVRIAARDMPSSRGAFAAYDAVVLDDVASEELNEAQIRALEQYVSAGGGLLLRGSERSLDPSGYTRTPLAQALPIDLRRRSGSRAPDLALAVVFDKSGSMSDLVGGVTKIELARRAVAAVQDVLPAGDALGVIAFDGQAHVVAPLAAGGDRAELRDRLRAIDASGSTIVAPAMQLGYEWLAASAAARRHVLLLSDGHTSPEDAARVVQIAATKGIALSVVATGVDVDRQFFARLAAAGGRVFLPDDVSKLPDILAREAARASGGWRVRERFTPRAPSAHPVLSGIDRGSLPVLDGYVAAAAKPGAEVAIESHLGDPLLAGWRHGLGRVVTFSGDVSPAFAAWRSYGRLWRQTVRWIARGAASDAVRVRLEPAAGGAVLVADAIAGDTFINGLRGSGVVTTPEGTQPVELRQVAPGRYEGRFEARSTGVYLAAVALRDEQGSLEHEAVRGFYWTPPAETPGAGTDIAALSNIAAAGGGRVLQPADDPFAFPRASAPRDMSSWAAAAALLLFLADVAVRRGVTISALRAAYHHRGVAGANAA
jgi:Ca-activated chloride channel homolog